MLLRRKRVVPEHVRRGIRLAVAVLVLSAAGFSLVGRPGCEPYVQLLKWALLTCPVVTMPLLGKTSLVSFERALGTLVGGGLGFLATAAATRFWTLTATEMDDIFLAAAAAAAAFASVLVGQRLGLDLSAKLSTLAFILVCFSSQEGGDPLVVAYTRVGGIVLGVVTMLALSVIILPKSATVESLHTLLKALDKLQQLSRLAWGTYLPPPQQAVALAACLAAAKCRQAGAASQQAQQAHLSKAEGKGVRRGAQNSALQEPLLPPAGSATLRSHEGNGGGCGVGVESEVDLELGAAAGDEHMAALPTLPERCLAAMPLEQAEANVLESEQALTDLYSLLSQLNEQLGLARTEVRLGSCGGSPLLLPGLPLWRRPSSHLPWKELEHMALTIRRVARLCTSVLSTFEDGFDLQLREALGELYPAALLPTLAAGCLAAIQELHHAFPSARRAPGGGLAAYAAAVESLTEMSERQRRQVEGAFQRHSSRAGARSSWAQVIDAVLAEQTGDAAAEPVPQQQEKGGAAAGTQSNSQPASRAAEAAGKPPQQSLASWLRRMSSSSWAGVGSDAATSASASAAAPGDAGSDSGAGGGQGQQQGSVAPTAGQGISPIQTASQAAAAAGQGLGLAGANGTMDPALGPSLLSRVSMRRAAADSVPSNKVPLSLFPATTQGRLAQVSFFSFMFVCEELREQLMALHDAVDAVLKRLPA